MNSDIQQERRNASFQVGNLSKALFEDSLKRREQLKDAVEVPLSIVLAWKDDL